MAVAAEKARAVASKLGHTEPSRVERDAGNSPILASALRLPATKRIEHSLEGRKLGAVLDRPPPNFRFSRNADAGYSAVRDYVGLERYGEKSETSLRKTQKIKEAGRTSNPLKFRGQLF
jgi:hypothetical protein